jgi:hypothetical protein
MVTSPEYRHVPTGTLAVLAQRLGTVCASASTWYRLVRKYGWRRPRLRVHPAKPKVGLRTTRADEMWHIDTTVIRLLDGTRAYLHAVIDNFSRRIWHGASPIPSQRSTAWPCCLRPVRARFLVHLRRLGLSPPTEPMSPADNLTNRYVAYLRTDRGLAENSILIYAPCVRAFLAHRMETAGQLALTTLDAEAIRRFLIDHVARRSSESASPSRRARARPIRRGAAGPYLSAVGCARRIVS